MRKRDLFVDARLADEGEQGVEIAFFYNGELSYRRCWPTRTEALADAAARRLELEREGWTAHW